MSSLLAKLRRKSHEPLKPEDPSEHQDQPAHHAADKVSGDKSGSDQIYEPPPGPPPGYVAPPSQPGAQPNVQYVVVPPPGGGDPGRNAHNMRQMGGHTGMMAGAVLGAESGGNPVMGMVEGQVVGTAIAQQVNQYQRHQYWRDQALNYRAGLPADGVGLQPPGGADAGGRNRSRSRSASRDERRRKRWERRAARREGRHVEGSSGSESD